MSFHEHQATQWLGVEVSRAEPEPELSLTQAQLDNIELGSWLSSITNEPDFKAQARLKAHEFEPTPRASSI